MSAKKESVETTGNLSELIAKWVGGSRMEDQELLKLYNDLGTVIYFLSGQGDMFKVFLSGLTHYYVSIKMAVGHRGIS